MAEQNDPRFHYDPQRTGKNTPSFEEIEIWCQNAVRKPASIIANQSPRRAHLVGSGMRDFSQTVAKDIWDLALEYDFNPTMNSETADGCREYCLLIMVMGIYDLAGLTHRKMHTAAMARKLMRYLRVTIEAKALIKLIRGMMSRGALDKNIVAMVKDDADPITKIAIDAILDA